MKILNFKRNILFIIMISVPLLAASQNKAMVQVEKSMEILRDLMINPDQMALDLILHDRLTYGHSSGVVEDKSSLIKNLTSGNSDFVTIDITEQEILVEDKTAIVRHKLSASIKDKGVSGQINLKIMYTWVKSNKSWKLLARQAVKVIEK